MDRSISIQRYNDNVTITEALTMFGPGYIHDFYVYEEHETPIFNGLRRMLGLESAEPHTTIVPKRSSFHYRDTSEISAGKGSGDNKNSVAMSKEALDYTENKGYNILTFEELLEQIDDEDDIDHYGLKSDVKKHLWDKKRKERRLERLRKDREKYRERYDEDFKECDDCEGFLILAPDSDYHNGQFVYHGVPVTYQDHEEDCELHPMNRKV